MRRDLIIRPATAEDAALMLSFIHELATFERAAEEVTATEADLIRDGFGEIPRFHCLLAEVDSKPAGFALYCYTYSTWEGNAGIHLEDLFVRESFRGSGVGRALLMALVRTALDEGCKRLNWNVLHWNQPAIDFYRGLGAVILEEWKICRLSASAMRTLVEQTQSEQTQSEQTEADQTEADPTRAERGLFEGAEPADG